MINQLMHRLHGEHTDQPEHAYTLAALFDDFIDTEHALLQLRRSRQPASLISVILREKVLEKTDGRGPYCMVLSEVVEQSSLEAVGKWLQGLVSLVMPDRATYLAAGPIGMILSTIRDTGRLTDEEEEESIVPRAGQTHQLAQTLQAFGFELDEAMYVEQRVIAGSALIAATSESVDLLRQIHQVLSAHTPVYLGLARTDVALYNRASRLITTGPRTTGTVVIADAASPLVHVMSNRTLHGSRRDLRDHLVRSQYGEIIGRVSDVLYEPYPEDVPAGVAHAGLTDSEMILRYLIVRLSGKLGVSRQRLAFPGERVRIVDGRIEIVMTHEELEHAPRFAGSGTLSRQEEATIRRHWQSPFYWITDIDQQ